MIVSLRLTTAWGLRDTRRGRVADYDATRTPNRSTLERLFRRATFGHSARCPISRAPVGVLLLVVLATKPTHCERTIIGIVMAIDARRAADFARLGDHITPPDCVSEKLT